MTKKICELCGKESKTLSEHHLIPKQWGGKNSPVVLLCINCHNQLHALFTNRELSYKFNSIDKIKEQERIKPYLNFIKDKDPDIEIPIKRSRYVRKKGRY